MTVCNREELVGAAATFLAWASLVALGIALDPHVKFKLLLNTPRSDEWDMALVWERRSHCWRGIGLVTFGVSILFLVAWTAARTIS